MISNENKIIIIKEEEKYYAKFMEHKLILIENKFMNFKSLFEIYSKNLFDENVFDENNIEFINLEVDEQHKFRNFFSELKNGITNAKD